MSESVILVRDQAGRGAQWRCPIHGSAGEQARSVRDPRPVHPLPGRTQVQLDPIGEVSESDTPQVKRECCEPMTGGGDGRRDRITEPTDVRRGRAEKAVQSGGSQPLATIPAPHDRHVRRTVLLATAALGLLGVLLVASGVGRPRDAADLSAGPADRGGAAAAQPLPVETTISVTTPDIVRLAPSLLTATGDALTGRVTLHFSGQVVEGGPPENGRDANPLLPDPLAATRLVVYGDTTSGCSTQPQGSAHQYLSGLGTDTITTDASGLVGGTVYITVGDGFVRSAADGTPYLSTGCIHINVTNSGPGSPAIDRPVGGPELLSAEGDRASGRINLRVSRPVVAGDGPGEYGPAGPPLGTSSLAPMQLVFYGADSTCLSPLGNAHQFVSGLGTDSLTLDAVNLVVGTTYISISPGFVKGAAGDEAAAAVPCLAVIVNG